MLSEQSRAPLAVELGYSATMPRYALVYIGTNAERGLRDFESDQNAAREMYETADDAARNYAKRACYKIQNREKSSKPGNDPK